MHKERRVKDGAHDNEVLFVALVRLDAVHAVEARDECVRILHHVLFVCVKVKQSHHQSTKKAEETKRQKTKTDLNIEMAIK